MSQYHRIPYDGDYYDDIPRVRLNILRADEIKKNLPSVEEGHTRLWRGNRPGEVGQNPSFTNSLVGIALPFRDGYGGELSYVDVPAEQLEAYLCRGGVVPNAEFRVPPEIASKAKIVDRAIVCPGGRESGYNIIEKAYPSKPSLSENYKGPKGWAFF
ncbi:MAG: hypothetical protein PHS57_03480 [Alphaproteobacteria bacterium]|nr:hypothetical protein [Alphaproteobacteria bacterium]